MDIRVAERYNMLQNGFKRKHEHICVLFHEFKIIFQRVELQKKV